MKRIVLIGLLLAGCTTTPPVREVSHDVAMPVAVYPVDPASVPTRPAPLGPRPPSLSAAADLLLADHCAWVAFGLIADPLVRAGAHLPPLPLVDYPECRK